MLLRNGASKLVFLFTFCCCCLSSVVCVSGHSCRSSCSQCNFHLFFYPCKELYRGAGGFAVEKEDSHGMGRSRVVWAANNLASPPPIALLSPRWATRSLACLRPRPCAPFAPAVSPDWCAPLLVRQLRPRRACAEARNPSGSRRRPTQGRLLRPRRGGRRLASRRPSASHGSARRRRVAFAPVLPSRAWGRVAASCDGADKRGKKRNGFGRRERPIGMLTESTVRFVVRWWADVCFVPRGIFGALPSSGVWSTTKACGRSRHARLAWVFLGGSTC